MRSIYHIKTTGTGRKKIMTKLTAEIENKLIERFSKDTLISLATSEDNMPYVRTVDAYYADRSFYVLTYALSSKMKQIGRNPNVAISGDWFTARGRAVNLGYFYKKGNEQIANTMKTYFASWIDNGHNNFDDENTVILQIRLTEGTLTANNEWIDIDFT